MYPNAQMSPCVLHPHSATLHLLCDSVPRHNKVNIFEAAPQCLSTPNKVICFLRWMAEIFFLSFAFMYHVCIPPKQCASRAVMDTHYDEVWVVSHGMSHSD